MDILTESDFQEAALQKLERPLFELLTRVLCDTAPDIPAEAAYLFSQTTDNQKSVFTVAMDLATKVQVEKILISDSPAQCGYPGLSAWVNEMTRLGFENSKLTGVPNGNCSTPNTLSEAMALVRYAKEKALTRIFVVAAPFHQLRAFATTVSVLLKDYPKLRVYNRPGEALTWGETVVHSQGKQLCKRSEAVYLELDRIERYQKKDDLVPIGTILSYLNWRDS